jgi:hypothetical protein
MFLDIQICNKCEYCKDWGRTIDSCEFVTLIPCPKCHRKTWPNLGVNIPTGSAVALAGGETYRSILNEYK